MPQNESDMSKIGQKFSIQEENHVHSGIKYLGCVEIKQSLVSLPRKDRANIIDHAINKILQRYGRTNLSIVNDSRLKSIIGRSPMSTLNDTVCRIKIISNAIKIEAEISGLSTIIFSHSLDCISIATIDHKIPTLFCYVANPRVGDSNMVSDRRLFLFECSDLIQAKKVIQQTHLKFKQASDSKMVTVKSKTLTGHHKTNSSSIPPTIPQRCMSWTQPGTRRDPPPIPKKTTCSALPASAPPNTSERFNLFTDSNYLSPN